MKKHRLPLLLGILLLALFLLVALKPSLFTSYDRKEMFRQWLPISKEHLLGTNYLGYDIYTELLYGARDTIFIGVTSSVLSLLLGLVIGTLSSLDGPVGACFTMLTNLFVYLPKLVTLIVLSTFLGSSSLHLILLISLFNWVGTSRVVKGKILHLSSAPFIENCSLLGYSRLHTITHHYLRNLQDVVASRFLTGATSCIMMESTLSFLGFGDLYHPTWGTMVNYAWKRGAMLRHAYPYLLAPGIAIMVLTLSFFFLSLFFERRQEEIEL